jgi:hypothetical protein
VTVALTLVVRDEAEILEANLEYHLAAGVDVVLVTDHRSEDRTPEILEECGRSAAVRVFREDAHFVEQQRWQTRMARVAFAEYGADWVLLGDADEFWWPHGGSLGDALARVPDAYGSVLGLQRNFVPLRGDGSAFAQRMVVRLAMAAPINDPATPFRPVAKVAVRANPGVVVGKGGGHQVFGIHGEQLEAWQPLEILHFPLRSREQCARKYEKTWTGWQANMRGDLARAQQAADADQQDAMWERLALDDAAVQQGIEDGSLVIDTRLRDALRAIERGTDVDLCRSADPHQLSSLAFAEAELVRRQRWLDDLDRRVWSLCDRGAVRRLRAP